VIDFVISTFYEQIIKECKGRRERGSAGEVRFLEEDYWIKTTEERQWEYRY
jgi:hypothetical protein